MSKSKKIPRQKTDLIELFAYAKGQPENQAPKNAVIYTRVSSQEQAEKNTSLESQKRYCTEFAKRKKIKIVRYFGGTFESAKNDERREFQKMIGFVKKNRFIDTIIIYSYDRFSRTGVNAAFLCQELQQKGVRIIAVSQEVDTSTPSGKLYRDMMYLFSRFDNELRKDRTAKGMIESTRNGYWVCTVPFGYTNLRPAMHSKNQKLVINEDGEKLKLGFALKAEGSFTDLEIVDRLKSLGSRINYNLFPRMIRNPFYCGYVTNKWVAGQIYPGRHPPLVSEELFLEANMMAKKRYFRYSTKTAWSQELPLKIFARGLPGALPGPPDHGSFAVEKVGLPFTGYFQRGNFFYKTQGKGKGCVYIKADTLNGLFCAELQRFEFEKNDTALLEDNLTRFLSLKMEDQTEERKLAKNSIEDLDKKMAILETKFAFGEIPPDIFTSQYALHQAQKNSLTEKLSMFTLDSVTLNKLVNKSLVIAGNLSKIWQWADFENKRKLQQLVFPKGVVYCKMENRFFIPEVNVLFSGIASLLSVFKTEPPACGNQIERSNSPVCNFLLNEMTGNETSTGASIHNKVLETAIFDLSKIQAFN